MTKIDWTKPIEWVTEGGSVESVKSVRFHGEVTYPYSVEVTDGSLYCYEDGRICIDGCGYLRNVDPVIDWTKPLELMDGTPVVFDERRPNPDFAGDYFLAREDGELFSANQTKQDYDPNNDCIIINSDGQLWVDPNEVIIRNRAEPQSVNDVPDCAPDETLTIRDQFAMAALSAAVERAYVIADAMLEARKK